MITLGYDGHDRLETVVRPNGTDSYEYDAGGRLIEAWNAEAEVVFQYDAADRATHETTTFAGSTTGHTVVYRYDAAERVDRITYPGGVNVFRRHGSKEVYDINGCLSRVEDPSGNAVTFAYDPAGLRPIVGPLSYFVNRTKAVVAREYRLTQITDTIGR